MKEIIIIILSCSVSETRIKGRLNEVERKVRTCKGGKMDMGHL